jgi:hypothetical protein
MVQNFRFAEMYTYIRQYLHMSRRFQRCRYTDYGFDSHISIYIGLPRSNSYLAEEGNLLGLTYKIIAFG